MTRRDFLIIIGTVALAYAALIWWLISIGWIIIR